MITSLSSKLSKCTLKYSMVFLLIAAIEWLVISGILALIAAIKGHAPGFIENCEWLTYGRVHAAQHTVFVYGWACNAAFAIGICIMLRFCRKNVRSVWIVAVAGKFWNIGVFVGLIGILIGDMTAVSWLAMPGYALPMLCFSSLVIGLWVFMVYFNSDRDQRYVSQWYILGAFVWLPLAISGAGMIMFIDPVTGVVQAIGGFWYASCLYGLCLAPVALGAAYYIIPQVLGETLFGNKISKLAFWCWSCLIVFEGARNLIGGPVPVWIQTVGITASLILLFPVTLICVNLYITSFRNITRVLLSPSLRFIFLGVVAFMLVHILSAMLVLPEFSVNLHFSYFEDGISQLALQGFIGMILFGCIYYIMPKLLEREWPSRRMIRLQFWITFMGIFVVCTSMFVSGWKQGYNANQTNMDYADVSNGVMPFLGVNTIGVLVILVGQIVFAFNFYKMLLDSSAAWKSDKQTASIERSECK